MCVSCSVSTAFPLAEFPLAEEEINGLQGMTFETFAIVGAADEGNAHVNFAFASDRS
jgi:hypothetical protein